MLFFLSMNIPTKQLEIFFKRRNELIKELSIRKIDKLSFLEKNYELIQNLNMKPLLNISSLEEGMYNYQYYNILAKFFKQKSILYSNNKKKQKKYNENLMKSNNYYAEKDKYLLKMIDFLDEKTTGGLKISEQSVNLAVIISVASSILNKSVPRDNVFIAEVGLTGELKKVPNLSERLTELDRMGYKKVYTSNEVVDLKNLKTLKVEKSKTLKEVIDKVFRNV